MSKVDVVLEQNVSVTVSLLMQEVKELLAGLHLVSPPWGGAGVQLTGGVLTERRS